MRCPADSRVFDDKSTTLGYLIGIQAWKGCPPGQQVVQYAVSRADVLLEIAQTLTRDTLFFLVMVSSKLNFVLVSDMVSLGRSG